MDYGWHGNDIIFRTYVRGSGKKTNTKTSGVAHISDFDEVCEFTDFGALLNKGFKDISFDTQEESDAFMKMCKANGWKCMVLKSTHGIHTYWRDSNNKIKKDGANKKLVAGFKADIKSGDTYIPLKVDGKKRYPPLYDAGEYQEVPEELYVISRVKTELFGMKGAEGRNTELFNYILPLQSQLSLSEDTIRRIIRNINQFIFEEPLPENELNTILRDEAFNHPSFGEGSKFRHDLLGDYMIENDHVIRINGQLYIYSKEEGIYVTGKQALEGAMIRYMPNLSRAKRTEVMDYISLKVKKQVQSEIDYIAFSNCVYQISSGDTFDFTPGLIIINKIPWPYEPNSDDPEADALLDRLACQVESVVMLLEEVIGYCFYPLNTLRKSFIFTGSGKNGKSTFIDIIDALLGEENVSSLDLSELGDRFRTAELAGKLANTGDDIGDEYIQNSAIFKKLVTGERMVAERKGKDPFHFRSHAKLIFSANNIPKIKDPTGAVIDRLVIIPFNAKFSPDNNGEYKQNIKYDFINNEKAMKRLICLGLKGLDRILEHKQFTECDLVKEALAEYKERNNPVIAFLKYCDEEEIKYINEPTDNVYQKYVEFCLKNNFMQTAKSEFCKRFKAASGLEIEEHKINGKKIKIFTK